MTGSEFRAILRQLRLPQVVLASELGVHRVTVARWISGELAVPRYAVAWLELAERLIPPQA
jgi:DNA-binding transcriptional regulator YiaG